MFARVKKAAWISKRLPGGVLLHNEANGSCQPLAEQWARPGQLLEVSPAAYRHLLAHCVAEDAPTPPPPDLPRPSAPAVPPDEALPPPRTTAVPPPTARPAGFPRASKTPKLGR